MPDRSPDMQAETPVPTLTRVINLRVGEVPMAVTIPREEEAEATLRAAAKELNHLLDEYRSRYDLTTTEALTYAAIHLGRDKYRLLQQQEHADYEGRLAKLSRDLDQALDGLSTQTSPRDNT